MISRADSDRPSAICSRVPKSWVRLSKRPETFQDLALPFFDSSSLMTGIMGNLLVRSNKE